MGKDEMKDLSTGKYNEVIDNLKLSMARLESVNCDQIKKLFQDLMKADLVENESVRAELKKMSDDFLKVSENLCNLADFIERKFTTKEQEEMSQFDTRRYVR
jgi:hypothetical protein